MRIIYCSDPIKSGRVDEAFAAEENAARATGFELSLVDYEALVAGDTAAAVRRVVASEALAFYRGWMLSPVRYAALHDAMASRGIRLINDPRQYQYAHFFPESYPDLVGFTPESICIRIPRVRTLRAPRKTRTKWHAAHEGVPHLLPRRQPTILSTILAGRGLRRPSGAA